MHVTRNNTRRHKQEQIATAMLQASANKIARITLDAREPWAPGSQANSILVACLRHSTSTRVSSSIRVSPQKRVPIVTPDLDPGFL